MIAAGAPPEQQPHPDDWPGSLADPAVLQRRRAMLAAPSMASLTEYVVRLRAGGRGFVPDFDPLDGGTEARLLVLLEKPGPRTVPPAGSGFVSMNTNDPTAKTIGRCAREGGAPRRGIVLWNIVPWWNGTMALTAAEKRAGAAELEGLLALLPRVRGVLLAGNPAWEFGGPALAGRGLALVRCVHPSGQARAGPASQERWRQLPQAWREAWRAAAGPEDAAKG